QVVLTDTQRSEPRDERSLLLGTHREHCRLGGRYTNVTSLAAGRAERVAKNRGPGVWRRPMWARVRAFLLLATLTFTAAAGAAGTPISGFQETVFQGGLSGPTAIAFLPDGRMLITEQGGALKLSDGTSVSTLITIPVCSAIEMGLLGVAVDPNFASNGFVYLYRTKNPGSCATSTGRFNEVVRITIRRGDPVTPASLTVLVAGAQTDTGNHNGGCLRIGPDGKLYVGVGETGLGDNQGGPGSSTNPYTQDLSVLMGKILRIN